MRACRTCLTKKDLNPLFGELSAVKFTSKQLYLATGVQIQPNDNLPQVACRSCIKQIKQAIDFQYISRKTNDYLRQILKKVNIKSELDNKTVGTDDKIFDRNDVDKVFVEIKIEQEYFQDSDFDNNENDNSQFDNSVNYLDNKRSDNNEFDYQKNYSNSDMNKKSQPDNKNKYLDSEIIDNDHVKSCNSQSDNYHNSQLDKHYAIKNKQYSDEKNTNEYVTGAKRHKTRQINKKTIKNTIKKKQLHRKFKIQNDESNSDSSINVSKKINIKIEDFESDSGNSDISNDSIAKQEKAMKFKDFSKRNILFDGTKNKMEDKSVIMESKTNVKISRNMLKYKRNKLMSLAVTPYPASGPVECRVCHDHVKLASFVTHAKRHFAPEFTCEECGKMFRSHAHMVYHQQRLHGREKRLACPLCDYRTVDRLKLKNHERTHSGERPYACDECGATFRMRTNLLQHMRTHFGVRHVQCEFCANLFRSKSELANHKNKVHNKLTYLCYLCPQTYKGKKATRRHLINVHGELEDQILEIKCIKTKKYEEVPTI